MPQASSRYRECASAKASHRTCMGASIVDRRQYNKHVTDTARLESEQVLEQERRTLQAQGSAGRASVTARDHGGSVHNSPADRRHAPRDSLESTGSSIRSTRGPLPGPFPNSAVKGKGRRALVADVVATRTSRTPSRDLQGTRQSKQGTSPWFQKRMETMTSRASHSPGPASESLVRTASIVKSPGLFGATMKRTAAALQGSHLQALAGSKEKVAQTLLPRPSQKGVDDVIQIVSSVASASKGEGLLLKYFSIQACI